MHASALTRTAKFANTLLATPLASPGKGKHVLLARRFERFPGCSLRRLLHCRRERLWLQCHRRTQVPLLLLLLWLLCG